MGGIELSELHGHFDSDNGAFFLLLGDDTGWSGNLDPAKDRPWVFPDGYRPSNRRALNVAFPRTTADQAKNAAAPTIRHIAHTHECTLKKDGWIVAEPIQVKNEWVMRGKHICVEPSTRVLGRLQVLAAECW